MAFFESSDIRFKNIISVNPEVDVCGIDVIKFTRKDNTQVRFGYSAQQVKEIISEVVVTNDRDELTVNYSDIHTLKIAKLEKEVEKLKEIIKTLI